ARYLHICDGNMQEGSFRCDANVSVRKVGTEKLGTRTEIKNVNCFRFVEKAINYEIERQIDVMQSGGTITQETRLYDSQKNETRPMRSKEEANDYRYFPDPDLLPLEITAEDIQKVQMSLPELPHEKLARFMNDYGLSDYDASVLTSSKELAQYFEDACQCCTHQAKLTANWVMGDLLGALNKDGIPLNQSPVSAKALGSLIQRIADNTISGKIAKTVFEAMWQKEGSADEIIEKQGLKQVTDTSAIETIIDEIIAKHPEQLADYRSGKDKLFGFFVGQVMKASKGKANPGLVNDLLKQKLQK